MYTFFLTLILGVGIISFLFSMQYLRFHKRRNPFLCSLAALSTAAAVITLADNIFLVMAAWALVALLLPSLIGFDQSRQAQKAEAFSRRYLLMGLILLGFGFMILFSYMETYSLKELTETALQIPPTALQISMLAIVVGCLIQGSVFPFHKWLLSSMTAPTPASAFMHAGLVSSGGILLLRLYPILSGMADLSFIIFCAGCLSAFLGNIWMQARPDVKSYLGCSTVSQMGFMLMQIGLGCYTSAVLHIVLHGFYKSYHFLESPSVVNHQRSAAAKGRSVANLFMFVLGTFVAFAIYLWVAEKTTVEPNTRLLIGSLVSFVVGSIIQHLWLLESLSIAKKVVYGVVACVGIVTTYAGIVALVRDSLGIDSSMPLTFAHIAVFGAFLLSWFATTSKWVRSSKWLYLICLNGGQPHWSVTSKRGV